MNGDDELAKTLTSGLKFEETPTDSSAKPAATDDSAVPTLNDLVASSMPVAKDEPKDSASDDSTEPNDLDKLKTSALDDLKPLVGKLNLGPDEKFDTLLLIIRSTDDQSLLADAHAAAKQITDDTKRAQALLDIIKEVDYFNSKKS